MAVADVAADAAADAAPRRDVFKVQPRAALRALRRLLRDPDDTVAVFDIMRALSGRSIPKGYLRLLSTPDGGRIAYERTELADLLSDDAVLAACPQGSVGAAYRAFVQTERISAEGLAAESRASSGARIDDRHPFAWYARRLRDVHDVWHVLTGYGREPYGEACVVAFSHAQTGSAGFGLIAAAAALDLSRAMPGQPVIAAVLEAWRRGRGAAWLPAEDYPRLLQEPLEAARARLRIAPIRHPLTAR